MPLRAALSMAALLSAAQASAAPSSASAPSAPPRIEQRQPTAEERDSFDTYFREKTAAEARGARPIPPLFAPAFDIERQRGKPWQVIARVDTAPRHSAVDLCRQIRSSFIYDATAPKGRRWTEARPRPAAPACWAS